MRRRELAKEYNVKYKIIREIIERRFPEMDWSSAAKNVEENLLDMYRQVIEEELNIEKSEAKIEKVAIKRKVKEVKKKSVKTGKETKKGAKTKDTTKISKVKKEEVKETKKAESNVKEEKEQQKKLKEKIQERKKKEQEKQKRIAEAKRKKEEEKKGKIEKSVKRDLKRGREKGERTFKKRDFDKKDRFKGDKSKKPFKKDVRAKEEKESLSDKAKREERIAKKKDKKDIIHEKKPKKGIKKKESLSRDFDIDVVEELYKLEQKKGKVDIEEEIITSASVKPKQAHRPRVKKKKKKKEEESKLLIPEKSTPEDIANFLDKDVEEVIEKAKELDLWIAPTQKLTSTEIELICELFELKNYEIVKLVEDIKITPSKKKTGFQRAPIITVMGHIDHGKTTLLDAIRNTNVAKRESGGITQHIGASYIKTKHGELCLIDTPGHSAFTTMRARGAQVCDIVVLVVAADDGVKPQTIEAINHARSAGLPIIVAINKIDKNNAKVDMVKNDLAKYNIIDINYGGNNIFVEVSALKKIGIDDLLEAIQLQASEIDLSADPKAPATGFVLESRVEKGKGNTASVIVTNGTLKQKDVFYCGLTWGKVRIMTDQNNKTVKEALPSHPVVVASFDELPEPGDVFNVVKNEKEAKEIAREKKELWERNKLRSNKTVDLETLFAEAKGEIKKINIILKADVAGTLGALEDIFKNFKYRDVTLNVIHSGLGDITENDIMLSSSSNAIIIGFKVKIPKSFTKLIDREKINIHIFNTIFEIEDYLKEFIETGEEKEQVEKIIGKAEIRAIFTIGKNKIAGCYLKEGEVRRNSFVRVYRKKELLHEGSIESLKHGKDDAKVVTQGMEFGLKIKQYNDIEEGDLLEFYIYE